MLEQSETATKFPMIPPQGRWMRSRIFTALWIVFPVVGIVAVGMGEPGRNLGYWMVVVPFFTFWAWFNLRMHRRASDTAQNYAELGDEGLVLAYLGHRSKPMPYSEIRTVRIRKEHGATSRIPLSREPGGPSCILEMRKRRLLPSQYTDAFLSNEVTLEVLDPEGFAAALEGRLARMT
jgi:hypothetical protein